MADEPTALAVFQIYAANREDVTTCPENLCDVPAIAKMKVVQNTCIVRC